MYDEKTLTGRLNTLYAESGLTQEKFAESCNIKISAMQNYIKGTRSLPSDKIPDVCQAYSVSADWLLGLSDVRKPSAELRGVCEFTGLSEEAINRIVSPQIGSSIGKLLSRLIEKKHFFHFISTYKVFTSLLFRLKESDINGETADYELQNDRIILNANETLKHFRQELLSALDSMCEEEYQDKIIELIQSVSTPFSVEYDGQGKAIVRNVPKDEWEEHK